MEHGLGVAKSDTVIKCVRLHVKVEVGSKFILNMRIVGIVFGLSWSLKQ